MHCVALCLISCVYIFNKAIKGTKPAPSSNATEAPDGAFEGLKGCLGELPRRVVCLAEI